mgnify:CR=1 FL=1
MKIEEFKKEVYTLAKNNANELQVIEDFMLNFYKTKPLPVATLSPDFLIRCSKNESGEVFRNVSRCSYNPNPKKIFLQRCNYPEQQVFYASVPSESKYINNVGSAIMEVMAEQIKQNDNSRSYLTLSRWKLKRKINVYIFPFGINVEERNISLHFASQNFENIINSLFESQYDDAKVYFLDSLKFISECLSEMENKEMNYRITSAFFNSMMKLAVQRNIKLEGMVYPSANTLAAGTNVVLDKELIDDKMVFCDQIVMYAMRPNPADFKSINFVDVSDSVTPDQNGDFRFKYIT